MENKTAKLITEFLKNNWFKLCIVIASFIVAISLYQSLVVIPREEARRKEAKESLKAIEDKFEKEDAQRQLNLCLSAADIDYGINWNSQCKTFGVNHKGEDCTLPKYNADTIEGWKSDARNECFRKYPQ